MCGQLMGRSQQGERYQRFRGSLDSGGQWGGSQGCAWGGRDLPGRSVIGGPLGHYRQVESQGDQGCGGDGGVGIRYRKRERWGVKG